MEPWLSIEISAILKILFFLSFIDLQYDNDKITITFAPIFFANFAASTGAVFTPLFVKIINVSFSWILYFFKRDAEIPAVLSAFEAFLIPFVKFILSSSIGHALAYPPALCNASSAKQWLWPVPNINNFPPLKWLFDMYFADNLILSFSFFSILVIILLIIEFNFIFDLVVKVL